MVVQMIINYNPEYLSQIRTNTTVLWSSLMRCRYVSENKLNPELLDKRGNRVDRIQNLNIAGPVCIFPNLPTAINPTFPLVNSL